MRTMVDIIIPYKHAKSNGMELRFALRSLQKHLTGYANIYLIGDLPPWIRNVTHIPAADSTDPKRHEQNIFDKLVTACSHPQISNDFLMLHDDHFFLHPFDTSNFPYYYHRTLMQGAQANTGAYRTTCIRTDKLLRSMLLQTKDFDCHCPIVYNKKKFLSCFDGIEWKDYGYCIKSVYCNYEGVEGEKCVDLKLNLRRSPYKMKLAVQGRDWFSTGNSSGDMELFLAGLYPRKSVFEV